MIENEIDQIIQILRKNLVSIRDKEIIDVWLDMVRYLPARSAKEIKYILKLMEETKDMKLLEVYPEVIISSEPNSVEAWDMLESGLQSKVDAVKVAIEERLKIKSYPPT